jgi:hypothetical protein
MLRRILNMPANIYFFLIHLKNISTAPVIRRLSNATGNNTFHPSFINWSYLGRGKEALRRINRPMKKNVFNKNQKTGGKNEGPSHPPKNRVAIIADIRVIPRYSPTKNIPNFIPEYSE